VLKQRSTDPSPSYCPNCAIHHTKGTMILVEEQQRAKGSPG
jgi:hypothetical protein